MRVHVLQHVPFEGLGSIQDWLAARQATITETKFFESPALVDLSRVDLVIALGGPMSVNDEVAFSWLRAEKRFIAEAIHRGSAVLGICLGAQLIASALGARVYPGRHKEIGWFPVTAGETASFNFRFPQNLAVFHWHGETFDLPAGAVHLACSAACRHQAFQVGRRVLGLQFHLETTPESAEAIIANCRHELVPSRFVQSEAELRAVGAERYSLINRLMEKVLAYLTRREDPPAHKPTP